MKFKFLLTIFLGVFFLSPGKAGSQEALEQILQIGDSVLYTLNTEGARGYYDSVSNSPHAGDYFKYLALYKTGYSYIHEKEDFLALAYFTEIQLFLNPKTLKDSALFFLINLEIDVLTYNSVRIGYNEQLLEDNYSKFSSEFNRNEYCRVNYLMGEIYYQRLQYDRAHNYYLKNVGEELQDKFIIENTNYSLLWVNYTRNDHKLAIDYANVLFSKEIHFINKVRALKYIGLSYLALGEEENFIKLFYNNQHVYDSLDEQDKNDFVYMITRLAACYDRMGDYKKADSLFNYASEQKMLIDEVPWLKNVLYISWSQSYKRRGQLEKALEMLANESIKDSVSIRSTVYIYLLRNKAQISRDLGYYDEAIKIINEAVDLWNPKVRSFISNSDWELYASILRTKYFTYRKYWEETGLLNKLHEAHYGFKEVQQINYDIHSSLSSESRITVVRKIRLDYENLFLTAYNLYKVTEDEQYLNEVFNYSEEGRYIHFKGQVDFNSFLKKEELADELEEKERAYKLSIERIRFILNSKDIDLMDNMRTGLHEDLIIVQKKYDSILVILDEKMEKSSKQEKNQLLNIQSNLNENQAVISYFITEERLFLLYRDKYVKEVHEISLQDDIAYLALNFGDMVYQNPSTSATNLSEFKLKSYKLYNYLVKPVENRIKGKHLFVMPDKELSFVPFDLLLTDTTGLNYGELSYLIKHYPLSELYTLRQLATKRKSLKPSSKFVAFSPAYSTYKNTYTPLPGAKKEISLLSEHFRGKGFVDSLASKKNFFDFASSYDIIHMAAHTKVNDKNPVHSQFLLAEETRPLTLYEIYGMKYKAKLLVLSSCNTGKGKLKEGDGVTNLARGFFYAGINNVILTKWAIADHSSASVMGNFYKFLRGGNSTDQALQKAKVRYLEEADPLLMHPYYWAGYTSVGKPVGFKSYKTNYLYGLIALTTLGLVFVFYRRKSF